MQKKINDCIRIGVVVCMVAASSWVMSGCSQQGPVKNTVVDKAAAKPAIIKKPASSFQDTVIIHAGSAVIYTPDSLQMVKIKAVNTKPIFDMLVHDSHYQIQNAKTLLKNDWPKIRLTEVSKARYLLFVKNDKSTVCIDLDDKNDIFGLFLFDGIQNPVLTDLPNIATDLGFYFRKQYQSK